MEKKLILILVVMAGYGCLAQNMPLINTLKRNLQPLVYSQEQFDLLLSISWEYRFALPDSTIYYAERAYAMSEKLNLKKDLAKPYNFIGIALNYKGERLQSLAYHQRALAIAELQHDSTQLAHTYNTMGRLLFEQGMLQQAFSHYTKALTIFGAMADSSGIAFVNTSLANLYLAQQNFKKAEHAYQQVLAARWKEKNSSRIMLALIQIGSFFNERKQTAKSNYFLMKADSIGRLISDEINLAEVNVLLGENFLNEGNIAQAKRIGNEGYITLKTKDNIRKLPRGLLLMGKIRLIEQNYPAARAEFNEALKVSRASKAYAFETESYFQLARVAKKMGREKEEFYNMNRYFALKDSALDLELARRVEQVQFELQIETNKKENELLKLRQEKAESDLSQEKLRNTLYLTLVFFFLMLLAITFFVYRKQRDTNKRLEQQNKRIDNQNELLHTQNRQLQELNHEKNTLMSIVAHDLKSPLARITGLSALIKMEGTLNNNQAQYLQKLNEVTQGGAELIKNLLDLDELTNTQESPLPHKFDLSNLLNNHLESFRALAEVKNIRLIASVPAHAEFTTDPSDLSRIVDNLLSNAIKFSTQGKTVTLNAKLKDNHAVITISDEGPGFNEEDKKLLYKKFAKLSARPTGSESSNGLGLAIVRILVDRLNGTITLNSQQNRGSDFTVVIPTLDDDQRKS